MNRAWDGGEFFALRTAGVLGAGMILAAHLEAF